LDAILRLACTCGLVIFCGDVENCFHVVRHCVGSPGER